MFQISFLKVVLLSLNKNWSSHILQVLLSHIYHSSHFLIARNATACRLEGPAGQLVRVLLDSGAVDNFVTFFVPATPTLHRPVECPLIVLLSRVELRSVISQ